VVDRRYQVFVSSTYTDLVDERAEVIQAILELDGLPAGMEIFPAANDDQWTLIKRVIDQSDYYVVIVGNRYGSMTEEGISFTEKEYDYAVGQGIPVLGFVHGDPDAIPFGKSDLEAGVRQKLEAFRAKVKQKMVKTYVTPAELGSVVSRALSLAMRNVPREGWVRGSEAMTADVRAEIAELRAALADAQRAHAEDMAALDKGVEIDDSFAHGDDEIDLVLAYQNDAFGREGTEIALTYRWDQIFETLGPFMIDEASESTLRKAWAGQMWRDAKETDQNLAILMFAKYDIVDTSWGNLIVQLRALRLIETSSKNHGVANKAIYWTLTSAGDRYLVGLLGIKRP
jgi:hypothetical protein